MNPMSPLKKLNRSSHLNGEVSDWIGRTVGPFSLTLISTDPLSERQSYRVDLNDRVLLLKRYADFSRLEREISGCIYARNVARINAPAVAAINRPAGLVLLEFIPGPTLAALLRRGHDEKVVLEASKSLGRTTRTLHDSDVRSTGLPRVDLIKSLVNEKRMLEKTIGLKSQGSVNCSHQSSRAYSYTDLHNLLQAFCASLRLTASDLSVVHGDLWSANVIVAERHIGLVDFEWACIGDPILDTSRVFARGLVSRDLRGAYKLHPPRHLWEAFRLGYGKSAKTDETSFAFRAALVFGLVRTINHYTGAISITKEGEKRKRLERSRARIARALTSYLREHRA
jgi:tRNA A-37 threonylcarbamoyl transferase component Bud32